MFRQSTTYFDLLVSTAYKETKDEFEVFKNLIECFKILFQGPWPGHQEDLHRQAVLWGERLELWPLYSGDFQQRVQGYCHKIRWFHIQTLTIIKIKEEFIEKVFNHLPDDSDSLPIQMLRDSLKMVKRLSERNVGKIVADICSNGSVKSIDRKELKRKLFYLDTTSLCI